MTEIQLAILLIQKVLQNKNLQKFYQESLIFFSVAPARVYLLLHLFFLFLLISTIKMLIINTH
jgi:hypothetical protein